jgi:hypothetical protein
MTAETSSLLEFILINVILQIRQTIWQDVCVFANKLKGLLWLWRNWDNGYESLAKLHWLEYNYMYIVVRTSHMSDIRQMSVAMQWLVDFISMVTNSTLLCNNTRAVTTMERNCDFCWFRPTTGSSKEGAPKWQDSNFKKKKISGQKSRLGSTPRLTYWLTVSCKVSLTLTLTDTKEWSWTRDNSKKNTISSVQWSFMSVSV